MKSLIQNKPPLNNIPAGNISVSLTEMSIIRVKLLLLQQQIFLKINAMKTPSPEYNFVLRAKILSYLHINLGVYSQSTTCLDSVP